MKTAEGVARFEGIANEVADLVLEFGGALSGEHGDGLVRAPFQEKMFGPVLYAAFCQLKATFDPAGLLNPGKIVHAPPLTANLRFGPEYRPQEPQTAFDFTDFGGMIEAAEQCSGVGACRKRLTGTMCPSYMATGDEGASTRGRANALRLAMTGQLGRTELTDEALLPVLDLCLECKACKSECPTGVDMARLKSEFLNQYWQRHGVSRSARWLAQTDRIAKWGSRLAPLSNWLMSRSATKSFNEKWLGLDYKRPLPRFAGRTFEDWWRGQLRAEQGADVALFVDTFSNHFEPETLIAAVRLGERWQQEVAIAPRVCCGRPAISKGMLEHAAQQAETATQALLPLARMGMAIVFCEPSCYSAVVDDHPHLQRGAAKVEAEEVAAACVTFEQWAENALKRNGEELDRRSSPTTRRILLHGHCHQKALVGTGAMEQLLSQIPDCEVAVLDSGCCGMAGSFGYEHYEISRAVGERKLLPAIRELNADDCVVASGFSCRQQITHFTGVTALSPSVLLESAYCEGEGICDGQSGA
jgi:Fe-S oxidoreductase